MEESNEFFLKKVLDVLYARKRIAINNLDKLKKNCVYEKLEPSKIQKNRDVVEKIMLETQINDLDSDILEILAEV